MPKSKMTLSDIHAELSRAVDERYPPQTGPDGYRTYAWVVDVYPFENFAIVRLHDDETYRLDYTVSADGDITIEGEPRAVEKKYVYKGTVELVATSQVVTGTEALDLLDELTRQNPLFAALNGSPNASFIVLDLTTIGKASQHAGKMKFQLSVDGFQRALPTIISKPIHVTAGLDGHFEAGKAPKPIGAMLGGLGLENEDGTKTMRAIGTLWEMDFPEEVEQIRAAREQLGGSYEITFPLTAAKRVTEDLVEIGYYDFSGAAILKRTAAAHPESQLLWARRQAGATARVAATVPLAASTTTTPVPDTTRYGRRNTMATKFAGVPADLEGTVERLIADALKQAQAGTEVEQLRTQLQAAEKKSKDMDEMHKDMDEKHKKMASDLETATVKATALEAKLAELTTALEAATTEKSALQAQIAGAELDKRVEAEWTKLAAARGFTDTVKAEKLPILKKLVAGETVSLEETEKLYAGGAAPKPGTVVPLMAAVGGDPPKADVTTVFPTLKALVTK